MKRFLRIKEVLLKPQLLTISHNSQQYSPVLWHATIDQDRPVGSQATFREHTHNLYHIVLYTHGQGWYSRQRRYMPAQPGTCVLIHPGQSHDFISRRETSVYSELSFSYETVEKKPLKISFQDLLYLYSGLDISLKQDALLSPEDCRLLKNLLIQGTEYLVSSRESSIYHAHRTLAQIFDFLVEHCAQHRAANVIDNRIFRTREWIEEHYLETFEIDELVKMADVSKGYYFREFKKAFGITPLAYQQKLRIEAAKTLLTATNLRCNEIAYRTGFNDVYFFHRIFKKRTGQTPSEYRKHRNLK